MLGFGLRLIMGIETDVGIWVRLRFGLSLIIGRDIDIEIWFKRCENRAQVDKNNLGPTTSATPPGCMSLSQFQSQGLNVAEQVCLLGGLPSPISIMAAIPIRNSNLEQRVNPG